MEVEKTKQVDLLNIVSRIWRVVGFLSIFPAGTIFVFFDSPSPNWNANYFFLYSVISFPIVCYVASFGIQFLKNKYQKLAFYVALLPVLPLILIYMGNNWMSASYPTLRNQGNATPVGKCTLPVLDGGDGLETTGCGLLEDDMPVTGIMYATSEAHNWQFSYQGTGGITITVEYDGKSCPQISFLDSSGRVIEGAIVGYEQDPCPSRVSYFEFNPPSDGTYILRLTTPITSGPYWLKIYKH